MQRTEPTLVAEKDFAGRQTRGSRRHQEDAYAFSIIEEAKENAGLLVVVADGMGGHAAGEQASELAVQTFIPAFHHGGAALRERFEKGVAAANKAIAKKLQHEPELEGMGTTLLAACLTRQGIEWVSVGDSPLYLWRENNLTRLNEDHSFRPVLREMQESGELTEKDAAKHPLRNLLRAALTGDEVAMVDHSREPLPLRDGDVILAATDGIQTLSDQAIADALAKSAEADAATIVSALLQAVLDAGRPKQDNTTVAIIKPARAAQASPDHF